MRSLWKTCLLVGCLFFVYETGRGVPIQAATCLVTTMSGDVQGLDFGASCAFLGIPYAASTAGMNRWKPPQPRAPWAPAVLTATTGSPNCAQVQQPAGTATGIEDCLFLNLWTRNVQPAELAPVIVWFHTGGFTNASANFPGTNGRRFAEEKGTVIVAPNYRLGSLGFLAHNALASENPAHPTSGNYGLLDQQAALRWVRDNISRFGGDPNNVTIAGTSAGGASVALQLVSPGSAGLFHRAIVQSAHPSTYTTHDDHVVNGDSVAAALGCIDSATVLSCMRAKSQNQVLIARPVGVQQVVPRAGTIYWEPNVDGVVIPGQPRDLMAGGTWHRVPTIVGATRDEGWGNFITRSFPNGVTLAQYEAWVAEEFGPYSSDVLAQYPATDDATAIETMARVVGDGQFVCEARRLARLISAQPTPRVYLYSYEYVIDELSPGHVNHGFESNILFGNNYVPPIFLNHILNAADNALHDAMAGYWARFAATGNPGGSGDALWTAYGEPRGKRGHRRHHMIFDAAVRRGDDLREEACDFWSPLFLRTMLGGVPAATQ